MIIFMLLLTVHSTDMFGGLKDRPVVFKGGGSYNFIWDEVYWRDVFKEKDSSDFVFNSSVGEFLRVDLMLARFTPPKSPKYAWAFMEFTRRAHEFLFPKGLFNGYNFGLYTLTGSTAQLGDIRMQVIPIGISIGLFAGESPWFPYYSIGGGAGFVSENWDLTTSIGSADPTGSTSATAWYGRGTIGIIRELKNEFALDISVSFDYLTFAHNKDPKIPGSLGGQETIQSFKAEIGLDFAMPWLIERTVW